MVRAPAPMTDPHAAPLAPPVRAPIRRPGPRFLLAHPAHCIALGFGAGLSPMAPGTVGTLWAWAAYAVLQSRLDSAHIGWAIAVALPLGWWACTVTARHMGVADPGSIVWDEIVAFWLVLLFVPAGFASQLAAFAVFRFFDIVKPPPIRYFDAKLKSGFGVMFDDLIAAGYTLLALALAKRLLLP